MSFSLFSDFLALSPMQWGLFAVCVALVCVAGYLLIHPHEGKEKGYRQVDTRALVMGALCVALSFVLSYIRLFHLPQGGSITPASMLPILAYAYQYGARNGFLAAFVFSLLQFIQDPYFLNVAQFLLDYIFAFTILGLPALFKKGEKFVLGVAIAVCLRIIFHFLSGWIFFGMYAPQGTHPAVYSLVYQMMSVGPDGLICVAIAALPQVQRMLSRMSASQVRA